MMHMVRISLLATLVSSCGGSEPVDLGESYSVSTVEGSAPPRLVVATEGCDVTVRGGHLTFEIAGRFDLGLDVYTDCIRGGGIAADATYGYTGTAETIGPRVTFHTASGGSPLTFEGVGVGTGPLTVTVPGLVPLVDAVTVTFAPDS